MTPGTKKIRVFRVDDHPLVRDWLRNLLELEQDFEVVGEADETLAALARMSDAPPDVAVIDLSLKRGSGLDLIKSLRLKHPQIRAFDSAPPEPSRAAKSSP